MVAIFVPRLLRTVIIPLRDKPEVLVTFYLHCHPVLVLICQSNGFALDVSLSELSGARLCTLYGVLSDLHGRVAETEAC